MSKELVISAGRHETRVAIVEDDQVVEVYHQRENEYSLAGSIHKGKVTRVLPGMQSAFVDIGLERDAFLYVSDFFEDNEEYDKIVTSVEDKVLKLDRPGVIAVAPVPSAVTTQAEPEEIADVPGEEATVVAEAASPVAAPVPVPDPRRDDRDRRGRRSRRRRGQKPGGGGGRGLPDSKYYSPGGRGEPEPPRRAPEPEMAAEAPARADDFLMLPGESLAKYTHPDSPDEFAAPESEFAAPVESGTAGEQAEPAAFDREFPAVEPEPEPEAEPATEQPVAAAVEAAPEVFTEPEAASPPVEPAAEEAEVETAETAEDVDVLPTDAAEPVEAAEMEAAAEEHVPGEIEIAQEIGESESLEVSEVSEAAELLEAAEAGEGAEPGEAVEPVAEEEGPEPARIPTSLTATLREQGPRYLHRVSRRMRRRGREGREGREPREGRGPDGRGAAIPAEPRVQEHRAPQAAAPAGKPDKGGNPSITDLLREGQEIIVQIAKEPLGQKGARITSHIALPGRFLVYMPTVDHIGVSRKIPSDEERSRLKRVLQSNRTGIPGGYIVRTAGEGRTEEELRADMLFLYNLWLDMRQKAERRPAPMLIHHDLNVVERVLRDQLTSAFKSIWVDNEEIYESVLRFVQRFQPALVNRVKMYTRTNPIFEEFGVTAELEKALRPKVWLKSGGYIVINQTEALVAIDVNTGKYVGKSNRLEDTIVRTNTDAIKEIVRQIRLRDLGGIIVVDFIDMDERKNRQKVMQSLEEAMRSDRAPYKILQFNDFGLVAITRKRVKQSLERTLCTPCPYCEGAGYVKSPQTVVGEILQEAQKIARAVEGKDVMLRVAPEVARLLKSNQNSYLQELEEILGRTVIVKSDGQLHQEKFDLA
jgi:ribonuclease G